MNNKYYFVRHWETYWNKNWIMHWQYDIPLNYNWIKQANKLSEELKDMYFDICYCSPLTRAKKTALTILKHHRNTKIIYDDRLKELSKWKLEWKWLNSEKLLKKENKNFLIKFNIESKQDFFNRTSLLLNELEMKYKKKKF